MRYDFGDTAVAQRAAWIVERYANDDLTAEDVVGRFSDESRVETNLLQFRVFRRPIDAVVDYQEVSPTRATIAVRCEGRPATVRIRLAEDGSDLIRSCALLIDPAPGVTVRTARLEDGPALRELELRCPIVAGDVAVTYDRGEDYFAQHRLMGSHFQSVAEYEGRIVGTFGESLRPLRVGGTTYLSSYRFHLRVEPACRGLGILPALNAHQSDMVFDVAPSRPIVNTFKSAENETVFATLGSAQREMEWSVQVERLVIDCAAAGGAPAGRPSTPADAERIAQLLARSHGREELAPVFDANHVRRRLDRSPMDYTWADVLLGERAVLGVWNQRLGIAKERNGDIERSVRATAIDWGCEPGAEEELLGLLRAWCGRLVATGTTHVCVFTSPPSPGRDALHALAPIVEPYWVTVHLPEPADVGERGVYVDPIWF